MNNSLSFDASLAKAMRLLHSSEPDATEQLKSMLDECISFRKTPQNVISKPAPLPTVKPVISTNIKPQISAPAPIPPIMVPSDDSYCAVCKRSEQTVGNEMVECQECHSLYHIECHKQGLINENVKDPRFVWYCSACTSRRKKAKIPGKTTAPLSGNGSTTKDNPQQNAENSPFKSWSFIKKKYHLQKQTGQSLEDEFTPSLKQ